MEEIIFKASVDTSNGEKSINALEKELEQASKTSLKFQGDLAGIGERVKSGTLSVAEMNKAIADYKAIALNAGSTSPIGEFAIKKASELTHEIKLLHKEVGETAKGGKNLNLALGIGEGIIAGYTVFKGVMAATGLESEGFEKTLIKLESAMAIGQGVSKFRDSIEDFRKLKDAAMKFTIVQKIVTVAQWLWNAAVMANPVIAIAVAIVALIAGIALLVSWMISSSKANEENEAAVLKNEKALKKQTETLKESRKEGERKEAQELAMAKASGMSVEAIRKLELKLIDEKIARERSTKAILLETYELNKNALAKLRASGADEEDIKRQAETTAQNGKNILEQNDNIKAALSEKKDIQNRHLVEVQADKLKSDKAGIEASKKNKANQDKIDAKKLDDAKKLLVEMEALRQAYSLRQMDEENREIKLRQLQYNSEKEQAIGNAKLLQDLEKEFILDNAKIIDKFEALEKNKTAENAKIDLETKLIGLKGDFAAEQSVKKQIAVQELKIALLNETLSAEAVAKLKAESQEKIDAIDEETKAKKFGTLEDVMKAEQDAILSNEQAKKKASENEKDAVNKKYKALIEAAEAYGQDITALEEAQARELARIKVEGIQDSLNEVADALGNFGSETGNAFASAMGNSFAQISSSLETFADESATNQEKLLASAQAAASIAQGFLDASLKANQEKLAEEESNADSSYKTQNDALKEKLRIGVISQEQFDRQSAILLNNANKIKDAAGRKAFEQEKKLKIASMIISGVQGALQAFTGAMSLGPIAGPIVGGVLAGAVGVMTAQNIKKVKATQYEGGDFGSLPAVVPPNIDSPSTTDTFGESSQTSQLAGSTTQVVIVDSDIKAGLANAQTVEVTSSFG